MSRYDTIIIGAGMSGLAAGIRLAHYGKRVCILERHALPGGLNSYYRRGGRDYDVGLHAITNVVPRDVRSAPLNRVLRQLRLDYEALELVPQRVSRVRFPECELSFTNDFRQLQEDVARQFPAQRDGFAALVQKIRDYDAFRLDAPGDLSARAVLAEHLASPLLVDMLLCPLLYYGSAVENDAEFAQFCILFRSIFLEGMGRPRGGIRPVMKLLLDRYAEGGGELRLRQGVRSLRLADGRVAEVVLDDGAVLLADTVLSCAGALETLRLCEPPLPLPPPLLTPGRLTFVETMFLVDRPAAALGCDTSILFFNRDRSLCYRRPDQPVQMQGGVLCAPGNFGDGENLFGADMLRLTQLADYEPWLTDDADAYRAAKAAARTQGLALLEQLLPGAGAHVQVVDLFTPRTVRRFTGHLRGAVYGSPQKLKDGRTPVKNLYICGTDQGFLGIVGALMSGVSMANLHVLKG